MADGRCRTPDGLDASDTEHNTPSRRRNYGDRGGPDGRSGDPAVSGYLDNGRRGISTDNNGGVYGDGRICGNNGGGGGGSVIGYTTDGRLGGSGGGSTAVEYIDRRNSTGDDTDSEAREDVILSSGVGGVSGISSHGPTVTTNNTTTNDRLPSRTTVLAPSQVVLSSREAANTETGGCKIGLYGWRRRCLYLLLLFLTATVTLNLALTLFFMRVLDFSSTGLGALQIVRGGLVARGPVHVMDTLVATHVTSRPHLPLTMVAAHNVTVAAMDDRGRVASAMVLGASSLSVSTERFIIKDPQGRLLFSASKEEVVVGARRLVVAGEGGASFSGSVQTGHVSSPVGKNLLLESTTRSLGISAPQGVSIESRAGSITAHCLEDLTLQSTGGMIRLSSSRVVVRGLPTSTVQSTNPAAVGPDVYQVCVCSGGKLFLAPPGGVCAADHNFCK